MAYFVRRSDTRFSPTEHVGGAWEQKEQHIAPALGLLVHAVERHRDARGAGHLVVSRLSYDILGTIPIEDFDVIVKVLRPGRTVQLVEATMHHRDRVIVSLRAWLLQPHDTGGIEGTHFGSIPSPVDFPGWDPTKVWPGGFIASVWVRRGPAEPGRAVFWVRTDHALVAGERVSTLAARAGLLDISNGMAVRADPRKVAFPNVDLTAHLFRAPVGNWLGFDTRVTFGATGLGLTHSVLHDELGPLGTSSQGLTVRPLPDPSGSSA